MIRLQRKKLKGGGIHTMYKELLRISKIINKMVDQINEIQKDITKLKESSDKTDCTNRKEKADAYLKRLEEEAHKEAKLKRGSYKEDYR